MTSTAVNGSAAPAPAAPSLAPPPVPPAARGEPRHAGRQGAGPAAPTVPAPPRHEERQGQRQPGPRPRASRAAALRPLSACYALMAVVTIAATGIGFWLSYAGLHTFAARAGLHDPEAWAWPSSVDLFILAGELGITISTLRDGKADWRAWVYFAAGCGPSVTFNVLHVALQAPGWGRYAVAATPPLAAMLALGALMQQVISLPDALRHMHGAMAPAAQPPAAPAERATKSATRAPAAPANRPSSAGQGASARARAAAELARNPDLPPAELAAKARVSKRTANRALKDAAEAKRTA